jgi:hypothetical protein
MLVVCVLPKLYSYNSPLLNEKMYYEHLKKAKGAIIVAEAVGVCRLFSKEHRSMQSVEGTRIGTMQEYKYGHPTSFRETPTEPLLDPNSKK